MRCSAVCASALCRLHFFSVFADTPSPPPPLSHTPPPSAAIPFCCPHLPATTTATTTTTTPCVYACFCAHPTPPSPSFHPHPPFPFTASFSTPCPPAFARRPFSNRRLIHPPPLIPPPTPYLPYHTALSAPHLICTSCLFPRTLFLFVNTTIYHF